MSRTIHKKKYRFSERKKFRKLKRMSSKKVRQSNETNFSVLQKLKTNILSWRKNIKTR